MTEGSRTSIRTRNREKSVEKYDYYFFVVFTLKSRAAREKYTRNPIHGKDTDWNNDNENIGKKEKNLHMRNSQHPSQGTMSISVQEISFIIFTP